MDNTIKQALVTLKRFCADQDEECTNCPLAIGGGIENCYIQTEIPEEWDVGEIKVPKAIDYRSLLKKYMEMVGVIEGTTFTLGLDKWHDYSKVEIDELNTIDWEIDNASK